VDYGETDLEGEEEVNTPPVQGDSGASEFKREKKWLDRTLRESPFSSGLLLETR
jgi:hypothetical protein